MGQFGQPAPKPLPRGFDKRIAKRDAEQADRAMKMIIKARDKYQCRCCSRRDSLDVHERRPRSIGGPVDMVNSLTLCRLCHQLAQQYRIVIEGETCDGPLLFTMAQKIADLVFPSGRVTPQVHVTPEV